MGSIDYAEGHYRDLKFGILANITCKLCLFRKMRTDNTPSAWM